MFPSRLPPASKSILDLLVRQVVVEEEEHLPAVRTLEPRLRLVAARVRDARVAAAGLFGSLTQ